MKKHRIIFLGVIVIFATPVFCGCNDGDRKKSDDIKKDDEVDFLANLYLTEGAITNKHYEDAMHIALATINKVDVLVSWNFKHIVRSGSKPA